MAHDPAATRANWGASASSPGASTWKPGRACPALLAPQHRSSPSGSTAHACCARDALTCRNWWFWGARHWPCRQGRRERGNEAAPCVMARDQHSHRRVAAPAEHGVVALERAGVRVAGADLQDAVRFRRHVALPVGALAWRVRVGRGRGRLGVPPRRQAGPAHRSRAQCRPGGGHSRGWCRWRLGRRGPACPCGSRPSTQGTGRPAGRTRGSRQR